MKDTEESLSTSHDRRESTFRMWVVTGLIAASVLLLAFAALLAGRTIRTPFPGFLTDPTLVVNDLGDPDWPGYAAGLHLPDQLVAVDGEPVERATDLVRDLMPYQVGDLVTLTVRSEDGTLRDVPVRLTRFPAKTVFAFFILPYSLALIYLGIGIWVFRARRRDLAAQVFAALCVLIAMSLGLLFDMYTTHRFPRVWITAISLIGSTLVQLAMVFPQQMRVLKRTPALRYLVYLPGVAIAAVNQFTILNFARPTAYFDTWLAAYIFASVGVFGVLGMMIYRARCSESPVARSQGRVILLGSLLAFGPMAVWFIVYRFFQATFSPVLLLPWLVFFPISIAYAIFRYRLFNVNLVVSRSLAYALLSALGVGTYFFLLYLIDRLFGVTLRASHPFILGIFILLLGIILNQVWGAVRRSVDRVFLGDMVDRREIVDRFATRLTEMMELSSIVGALDEALEAGWAFDFAALYLYNPQRACYTPEVIGERPFPSETFTQEGPVAHRMLEQRESFYFYQDRPLPDDLRPEREALRSIGQAVFIPVPGHGWLALGLRHRDDLLSLENPDLLESLGSHVAVGLEKAGLVSDLRRRVEEVDVLRWVGHAVTFTMDVDDLMELVYTQTGRVLDTTNFYIALYNPEKETLSFAFYVENNERLYPDDEWSVETGLTGEIVRSGRPIVTDNYIEECRRRGIEPGGRPGRAWMGVPLSGQDENIGVMNVSSYDPAVSYSDEQLKIFSAIADHTAAILYKARLYREMEERNRQLAVLNEVGSIITSTLDLDAVLNLIVDKAVELLQAEAGSLILIDEETGELVFEVATGSDSTDLVGTRLPPDTGIAGAVIEEKESTIIKDAQADQRWYKGVDDRTQFVTHSIIAVPMVSRGRAIGVIELLNRRDGVPFDEDDEQLLTAFATNAAISIENARLFTQTDQALAERVEELSMMQRIDRDLNATLDYRQVLETTLDWALEMTGADVALLAMVDETEEGERGLRLLVQRGYPGDMISEYREKLWPLDRGVVGRTVRSGEPNLVEDVKEEPDYVPVASGMVTELAVPIQREEMTVGVIVLEASQAGVLDDEALEFVLRLADHAAIAIENARLFEQVRRANEAKTEFISFVSHELKQPMTSMKGYTDLLLKGTGGELTEVQRSFLNTIRSNVDRMGSLVSELLDMSRIESGRIELQLSEVSMEQVIQEALRAARGPIEDKKQEVEVEVAPDLPHVRGDKDRLVQVLTNLLSNARKYTPEGGHIVICARRGAEEIEEDGFVECSIADTGIGISPEDQERLFTKYFRADHPTVQDVPGTGLGLVITRNLVEMHGGEIWLESKVDEGTTFTFTIPVAE